MIALGWLACATPTPPPAPVEPGATPAPSASVPLPDRFELGRPATPEEVAALDLDVNASWDGLPPGRGTVAEGEQLFATKCMVCHGPDAKGGKGWLGPQLVATEPLSGFEKDWHLPRVIGTWWPHASTVFDYTRRSMPQNAPGSLSVNETYALTAFLLARNNAVPVDFVADQDTLKTVKMPTRVTFVPDDRESTTSFR